MINLKERLSVLNKIVLLLFMLIMISSCAEKSSQTSEQRKRPDNVPVDAFWQGGVDGGQWYQCKNSSQKFQYHCVIYDDVTGDIDYQGDMEFYVNINNGSKIIPLRSYLQKQQLSAEDVNFFDGDLINLSGSLLLKPVKDNP